MNWIFDLDGTLYDARAMFSQMNSLNVDYLSKLFHIGEEAAYRLMQHYLSTYGSLANGLSHHHEVDFDTFFTHFYQLDLLLPLVPIHPDLQRIREFEGSKFILSNAPALWVNAVLDRLGISDVFDAVYCCDSFAHEIKPSAYPYMEVCRRHGMSLEDCVFFDDTVRNVATANDLGMRGVHVSVGSDMSVYLPDDMISINGIPNPSLLP